MEKIKAIAIDDEPLALSIISQYCNRLGTIDLKTYSDPVQGFEAIGEYGPDLVFLDIEMNGVSGIDLAAGLPKGTCLVFTTAYAKFAIDGFELSAIDFLHKPFSFARFSTAVGKVENMLHLRSLSEEKNDGDLVVRSEYRNVNIQISDIQYIEAMDNYVKIYLSKGDPVVSQINLKDLADLLPKDMFMRIHKSYIVPLGKIAVYTKRMVEMQYKSVKLPVGRVYADAFIRKMSESL